MTLPHLPPVSEQVAINSLNSIFLKLAADDSQNVREMRETGERKSLCFVHNYHFYRQAGYRRFARRLQDEKNRRDPRKKGTHEIMWQLSKNVSRFDYFLKQLFYPLLHEKIPLSRAYLPLLPRDGSRHEKSVSWSSIKKYGTTVHTFRISHVFLISQIVCSRLKTVRYARQEKSVSTTRNNPYTHHMMQ